MAALSWWSTRASTLRPATKARRRSASVNCGRSAVAGIAYSRGWRIRIGHPSRKLRLVAMGARHRIVLDRRHRASKSDNGYHAFCYLWAHCFSGVLPWLIKAVVIAGRSPTKWTARSARLSNAIVRCAAGAAICSPSFRATSCGSRHPKRISQPTPSMRIASGTISAPHAVAHRSPSAPTRPATKWRLSTCAASKAWTWIRSKSSTWTAAAFENTKPTLSKLLCIYS